MNPLANLQPVNLAGTTQNALLDGFKMGDAIKKRNEAEAQKKATADFYRARIGGNATQISTATNALAAYDPKTVYEMNVTDKKTDTIRRAAKGDPLAKLEMWGVDPQVAMQLDKFQAETAAKGIDFIADAGFQMIKLPPEQRAAAWDQYIERGVQMGFDGLAQYRGQYSEQNLNSIIAKAGKMQPFQEFQQPKYTPVGENGLQGFQFGVPLANGAMAPRPTATQPATPVVSRADLEAQAAAAIAAGADPVAVRARMQELGGSVGNDTGGF
jgi:hypothetical protein